MKLKDWLNFQGRSSASNLAKQLGCTRSAVSRWATGRGLPTVANVVQIQRLTGGAVTVADFVQPSAPGLDVFSVGSLRGLERELLFGDSDRILASLKVDGEVGNV